MASDNPVISIDTKKKEHVGGNLYRNGSVYCTPFQLVSATVSDFVRSNNKAVLTKKLMMLWV
jgi:hypothetical protein